MSPEPRPDQWMSDTTPSARDKLFELRRAMTFDQKLAQFLELAAARLRAIEDRVRRDHPTASAQEVLYQVAVINLGKDLADRVYAPAKTRTAIGVTQE